MRAGAPALEQPSGKMRVMRIFSRLLRTRMCAAIAAAVVSVCVASLPTTALAGEKADAFTAGYVTAVLERELAIKPLSVAVHDGDVTIEVADTETVDVDRVKTLLANVESVRTVVVNVVAAAPATGTEPPEAAGATPPGVAPAGAVAKANVEKQEGTVFLPRGHLFEPLLADPRWPRFAASYQNYFGDSELDDVAAVSVGGEFPFLQWEGPFPGKTQLGLHGGIFSIFELDTPSKDLVNADYRIGLPLTYRRADFSAMARFFHQSSHLGDEFLLRNTVERINVSYEAVDLIGSYDFWHALRPYAGGGYLFDQDPSDLDPWWVQTGVELTSPRAFFGFLRPVSAADLQFHEENGWSTDLSLRLGVELMSPRFESQHLYFLLEYYKGRNPNGQFFDREVEHAGFGIYGYF